VIQQVLRNLKDVLQHYDNKSKTHHHHFTLDFKIASSDFDFGGATQQAYSPTTYSTLLYEYIKIIKK